MTANLYRQELPCDTYKGSYVMRTSLVGIKGVLGTIT